MRRNVIDGDRWITERLAFLRGLLSRDLTDDQRTAVEAEIICLSKERGLQQGGPRRTWVLRRWLRGH